MESCDVCIIGAGGVVGRSIARALAERRYSVIGLERHPAAGQETSGRNSRVIHSGFHEVRGTLKADLALHGSKLIVDYAGRRGVRLVRTGMLIAVPHGALGDGLWREANALRHMWLRGRATGVPFEIVLTPSGVRRYAAVRAIGGIFIPPVYVIDVERFLNAIEEDARAAGARFFYGTEATLIEATASGFIVTAVPARQVSARILINSAGLRANEISKLAGGPDYPIEFVRGDYYEIAGGIERWKVPTLVYPATAPGAPSKGIHFSPRTDGRLFIGPNARLVPEPGSYHENPAPKEIFLTAARKFLPGIAADDLHWSYCGIRPKIAARHGNSDFVIRLDRADPPLINLAGIDSPGLSASFAIAEHVARLVEESGRSAIDRPV